MVAAVRAFSGVVAGGLVVLTAVLVGSALIGLQRGFPGPGGNRLLWHAGLTVVAVAAQLSSDRRRGLPGACAALIVLVAAACLLVTQWWN